MRSHCLWTVGLIAVLSAPGPGFRADAPTPSGSPGPAGGGPAGQDPAALIDRYVQAGWDRAGAVPALPADDAEFVRRVYLDLVGRVPLTSEARAFLADGSPDKRRRLVERLLDSPGYVNHFTNVFRALLLPEADTNFVVRYLSAGFQLWLRQQLADNAGYDRLVRSLLTAPFDGDPRRQEVFQRLGEPSPVAFYLAKEMKAENLAASTSRLFLGVRLECAQCHNHPFAAWKREQFWAQAAFFAGLQRQEQEGFVLPGRELTDVRELAVHGTERVVQAQFLDGTEPRWKLRTGARETLADWVTAPENPFFARAAVNRLWAHFFGTGLVEPVDDFGEDHPPSHPELLDGLARQFAAHRFDLKFLIRAVTASRAYQLSSRATHPSQDDPRLFARMAVRGLSPDQLYDSLAAATGLRDPVPAGQRPFAAFLANSPRAEFLAKFATQDRPTEAQSSVLQALALMNGKVVGEVTSLERGETLAAVADAPFLDTRQKVETLYLATLSRQPRPEESDRLVRYVAGGGPKRNPRAALADVLWALLNSTEFVLNH